MLSETRGRVLSAGAGRARGAYARLAAVFALGLTLGVSACGGDGGEPAPASAGAGQGAAHGAAGTSGADAHAGSETFRIRRLSLRDPHLFLGPADLTDNSPLGVSVNMDLIPGGLSQDYDGDGFIDVSIIARVDGDQHLQLIDAQCKPSDPDTCGAHPAPRLNADWPIQSVGSEPCTTLPSNSDYQPAPELPAAPCLVTREDRSVAMTLGGVPLSMTNTRVAFARTAKNLTGLITGFVTQSETQQALLPSYVPVLAGSPLANLLHDTDRDQAQSPNGEDGYWFYVNFEAEPARYDP
jgi:hypothetical protein